MKMKYMVLLAGMCILLSSFVAAQSFRGSASLNTQAGNQIVTKEMVAYLRTNPDSFAVVDPTLRKQISRDTIKTASDDYLENVLKSPTNRVTATSLAHRIKSAARFENKGRNMDTAEKIRKRQLRTVISEPIRGTTQTGRIAASDLVTDAQLDKVLANCGGVRYSGTFFNTRARKADSFYRWIDTRGDIDRESLRKIISSGPSQNVCVNKAIRGSA